MIGDAVSRVPYLNVAYHDEGRDVVVNAGCLSRLGSLIRPRYLEISFLDITKMFVWIKYLHYVTFFAADKWMNEVRQNIFETFIRCTK